MKKLFMLSGLLVIISAVVFALTACSVYVFGGGMEVKKTDITDSFEKINISVDTADVNFVLTNDDSCRVEAYDRKKIRYDVSVENGTLNVNTVDERRWFERIFNPGGAKLTVYLPESEYDSFTIDASTGDITVPEDFKLGNLDIKLSTGDTTILASVVESIEIEGNTGDVTIKDITCGSLEVNISTGKTTISGVTASGEIDIECTTGDVNANKINASGYLSVETSTGEIVISDANCTALITKVSTGKCNLSDINCESFESTGDTGDVSMANLIASGKISIERSTGDVRFDRCDASELDVETSTGSVRGTLLTEKVFVTGTSTGRVDVPETTTGGKCKITTSTGDIKIEIAE